MSPLWLVSSCGILGFLVAVAFIDRAHRPAAQMRNLWRMLATGEFLIVLIVLAKLIAVIEELRAIYRVCR